MENQISNAHASTPFLREHLPHRQWIAGRILTLLSHFWRDDDPVELTTAIAADWVEVLAGMPQAAIQEACLRYLRDEPRKRPTPGAILMLAREAVPPVRIVPMRDAMPPTPAPPRATKEQAAAILEEAGFRVKRIGESE